MPPVYTPPVKVTAGAVDAAGAVMESDFTSAQGLLGTTGTPQQPGDIPVPASGVVADLGSGLGGQTDADTNAFLGTAEKSCSAYRTTTQSIAANSWTEVSMDGEEWDTSTMHDSVTNPGRVKAPVTGRYHARAFAKFAAAVDGRRGLRLLVNGSVVQQVEVDATTGAGTPLEINRILAMAADQYATMEVWHNSATDPLNVQAGAANNGLQLAKLLGKGTV